MAEILTRVHHRNLTASVGLLGLLQPVFRGMRWCRGYWSSLSAAASISTVSALALRIYALDAAIIYENLFKKLEQKPVQTSDPLETMRSSSKRMKESEN